MTDLTAAEMMERIKRGLAENPARFPPQGDRRRGTERWGTFRQSLLDALADLGWVQDDNRWYRPNGVALDVAYAALCDALPIVPGMSRESMQPLMEGGYPDADTWVEEKIASQPLQGAGYQRPRHTLAGIDRQRSQLPWQEIDDDTSPPRSSTYVGDTDDTKSFGDEILPTYRCV